MTFELALAQTCHPKDGDVVGLVNTMARQASASGADMIVFPESLMTRYELEKQAFLDDAQSLDGPFSTAIDAIAAECSIWIIYTMNEKSISSKPFNTAVVTDSSGCKRGIYRKVHLFDSSTTQESSRMSAANQIFEPIETPFGKLGIGICYDLRFPEYARAEALMGCDLLVYPAAWVDGPGKAMHWDTLLRARAIENEMFVAGVCRADAGYIGASVAYGPDGSEVARTRSGMQDLALASIDPGRITAARERIPVFLHRRPELYL